MNDHALHEVRIPQEPLSLQACLCGLEHIEPLITIQLPNQAGHCSGMQDTIQGASHESLSQNRHTDTIDGEARLTRLTGRRSLALS